MNMLYLLNIAIANFTIGVGLLSYLKLLFRDDIIAI